MKGKFIVIEGVDGSGKETQAKLLVKHLENIGTPVMYLDFPQYDGFYGQIIAKYLRGEFGQIAQISPYLVSIVYALDRSTVREEIQSFIKEGGVVIANRYVPSNMAHQAANIADHSKRSEFIAWIGKLEYDQLRLPHEDTVIYLDLPWKIGMKKSDEKLQNGLGHNYLDGKADIHEESSDHRKQTGQIYLQLIEQYNHWHLLNCTDAQGEQRSIEEIHQLILSTLKL